MPRPPQLNEIEPRLISRFEWGISIGLEKPDSRAILEKKASLWNVQLSPELIQFLHKWVRRSSLGSSSPRFKSERSCRFHCRNRKKAPQRSSRRRTKKCPDTRKNRQIDRGPFRDPERRSIGQIANKGICRPPSNGNVSSAASA